MISLIDLVFSMPSVEQSDASRPTLFFQCDDGSNDQGVHVYRTIVTGADGSESAEAAVRWAAELAVVFGSELHVVTVEEDHGSVQFEWNIASSESHDALVGAVRIADAAGAHVLGHEHRGDPVAAIIRVADEVRADLIVVGNRGLRSASRFSAASVPSRLALHAPCSVLTVRTV
jgi:nucleotide-binding universal stress UspA family protein